MSEEPDFSSFLTEAGWGDSSMKPMNADMGLRRYFDLQKADGSRALMMDMSRVGYEESLSTFVKISDYLNDNDIHAAKLYHVDIAAGLSVIEYLGGQSFGDVIHAGEDKGEVYKLATDVLYQARCRLIKNDLGLQGYKASLVWERLSQFVEFYMVEACDSPPSEKVLEDLWHAMAQVEKNLPPPSLGFCHADYHLENLIWRPDTAERYGLIDFQDGFWGPIVYDLLNLLEDARATVPAEIKAASKNQYCQGMSAAERESFDAWYVYLSAHFHCRVIGLFVKFSKENNSDDFLKHIPRLQNYIKRHLANPIMQPLKDFMEAHKVNLDKKITL